MSIQWCKNKNTKYSFLIFYCFFCWSLSSKANDIFFDFESKSLQNWILSNPRAWAASEIEPIAGNYSLHHILDTNKSNRDKISYPMGFSNVDEMDIRWDFLIRHGFNPSTDNNWGVFLMADQPADSLQPDNTSLNGYVVGVQYSSGDDTLRLWKITKGKASKLSSFKVDWEDSIGSQSFAAIRVIRTSEGLWKLYLNEKGDTGKLAIKNTVLDKTFQNASHFGVSYKYSLAQDLKLWIDNILIDTTFVKQTKPEPEPKPEPTYKTTGQMFSILVNEIMADPDPSVGLPKAEYLELLNVSDDTLNLLDWSISIGSTQKTFPEQLVFPGEYLIVCHRDSVSKFLPFGKCIGAFTSSTTLTNSGQIITLSDYEGTIIHQLTYTDKWYDEKSKKDGGWSLELTDSDNPCNDLTNWKASRDLKGGTPGKLNSVISFAPGNNYELADTVWVLSDSSLQVFFNEVFDSIDILNPSNYLVNHEIGQPVEVAYETKIRGSLKLKFNELFQQNQVYQLTISSNIKNCLGEKFGKSFVYEWRHSALDEEPIVGKDTTKRDSATKFMILVTEIMADPEPSIGLPKSEYLELTNLTDDTLNLMDWTLKVGSTIKTFPEIVILPYSFLIVCHVNYISEFSKYGNTIGLFTSSTSLTNSGQTIQLRDYRGVLIHEISYTDQWYLDDSYKAQGGWSFEMVDTQNPCNDFDNWKTSIDFEGGTPGKINSVAQSNPDLDLIEVVSVGVIGDSSLRVSFNENYDSVSVFDHNKYIVNNSIGNPQSIQKYSPLSHSIRLNFNKSFEINQKFLLTISSDIQDCIGNKAQKEFQFEFTIPVTPDSFDLVINEVLFDAYPNGSDFIEIYNRSKNTVDASKLVLAVFGDSGNIKYSAKLGDAGDLIFSKEYLAIVKDISLLKDFYQTGKGNIFQSNQMFSLDDEESTIVLMRNDTRVLDQFRYNASMHFELLSNNEGYSLERLNPDLPTQDNSNWHSAADYTGGATPGYKNSQYISKDSVILSGKFKLSNDVFSPDNDGNNDILIISYQLEKAGYLASIRVMDAAGRLVETLENRTLLGTSGVITWNGSNRFNTNLNNGIYIIYFQVYDLKGKVENFKKICVLGRKL